MVDRLATAELQNPNDLDRPYRNALARMRFLPETLLIQLIGRLHASIVANEQPVARKTSDPSRLVLDQLRRAPWLVYIGMLVLSLMFSASCVFRWGRFFDSLPTTVQDRHIRSWKNSRLWLKRDYIYFFQSFIVVSVYGDPEVAAGREGDPG